MIEADDLELVRRCVKGDRNAFEGIVDRYQKVIFNLALRMVNSHADAEDITQTVFIKAYEKLDKFNFRHKFYSWLYRIAVNESLNHLARMRPNEKFSEATMSPEPGPDVRYEQTERNEHVRRSIMALQWDHRTVIVLRHFHDLSYEEIGRILDIPVKRVKSRLFSARDALRNLLIQTGRGIGNG